MCNHEKYAIFTIGYTSFELDVFLGVLKQNNIDCVIDVRSSPYSSFYTDFNKENLETKLKQRGIHYRNYAKEFGARQENQDFFSPEGYLDFEKFTESVQFKSGVQRLKTSCQKGFKLVLMCAEKDPITCHRCIMVGRNLSENSFSVNHILCDRSFESQNDCEKRLLLEFCKKHKIDRHQQSLLPDALENLTDDELLKLAYKDKNAEIGFKREE